MPQNRLRRVALALIALLLTSCGSLDSSASPAKPSGAATIAPPTASRAATPTPTPRRPSPSLSPSPSPGLAERPFTVLLLGADHQGRTDAVMVVGVDIASHTLSLASIPRDTINVPLPGGGTFTNQKINAFYSHAAAHPATYPQGAARATVDMVGGMLGIEIAYYARTTFGGFSALTQAMGGVSINLPKAVVDPTYQITTSQIGVSFPKGPQTLNGKRALIFVRTRGGDNDFERQRRQQTFLIAAGRQLIAKPELLASLIAAQGNLQTDFPLDEIPNLLAAIGLDDTWTISRTVLGPTKYAASASCACGYALAPKLDEMRKLALIYFPWATVP